ncbi:MAG: hypothetical protein LBV72_14695 [Tannerella sp.]|nr:hypothetical protein [Tannerella sp.]
MKKRKVEDYFKKLNQSQSIAGNSNYQVGGHVIDGSKQVDPTKVHAIIELRKRIRDVNVLIMALNAMGVVIDLIGEADRLSVEIFEVKVPEFDPEESEATRPSLHDRF